MASSFFPAYQIVLICLLGVNIIFWFILLCWRIFCFGSMVNGLARCRQVFNTIGPVNPSQQRQDISMVSNYSTRGSVSRVNNDLPPPYEQAIKYPSLISISGQISGNNSSMFTHHNQQPQRQQQRQHHHRYSLSQLTEPVGSTSINMRPENSTSVSSLPQQLHITTLATTIESNLDDEKL
ncbi:uncharacterized protein LOC128395109 [Panonychus citri]|uniref:uncharacterized protein LOC128395109 n=1 Tax=Panonychus citri TaxID=50023 RepID=UPI002307A959|nr:uncharacterized protein LOC128395109 [Panonychus citri]